MKGWIGVDLDGTLAEYYGWKGKNHIGKPIEKMVEFVKKQIAAGIQVKIFTARAADLDQIPVIKSWLEKIDLDDLEITNIKDYGTIAIYDDRARQVILNTGEIVDTKFFTSDTDTQ